MQKQRNNDTKLPSIHRASLLGSSVSEYYTFGHGSISSALGQGYPSEEDSEEASSPAMLLLPLPRASIEIYGNLNICVGTGGLNYPMSLELVLSKNKNPDGFSGDSYFPKTKSDQRR